MIFHEVEKGPLAISPSVLVMADRTTIHDGHIREVTRLYLRMAEGTKILYVEESLDIANQCIDLLLDSE